MKNITLAILFLSCATLFAQKEIRQTVHYDFGSATLSKSETQKLDSLVNSLKVHEDFVIHLKGHTDAIGSENNNGELSTQRCYSVRTYLISKNIPANRITVESLGESIPAATNDSPDGRAKNRRVDIVVDIKSPPLILGTITQEDSPPPMPNVGNDPQAIILPPGPSVAGGYGFSVVTNTSQMESMGLTTQTTDGDPLVSNVMFCITSTPGDTAKQLPYTVLVRASYNPYCRVPDVILYDSQVDTADENQIKWMPLLFPDLKPVVINGVEYFEWTIAPGTPRGTCKNADCPKRGAAASIIKLRSNQYEIVSLSAIYSEANALLRGHEIVKNKWEFKHFSNDSINSPNMKVVVKDKNGQLHTAEVRLTDLRRNRKGEYILKKKMFARKDI